MAVVPKRSDQLIRRNIPEVPIDKVPMVGSVEVPELGIPNPHKLVKDLWDAMRDSGQARFYEPSDWAYAKITLHFANKLLKARQPTAMMLASVNQMLTPLLLTEGERRRVRMEVERNKSGITGTVTDISVADVYRERLKKRD
jgi:hypothetical protein